MNLEVEILKHFKNFTLNMALATDSRALGILGASGSGKSMTLRCIAGIERPDEGRIVLNNRVLFDSKEKINLPPQQRKVGYLFQSYALFPHMTVEENILCGMGKTGKQGIAEYMQLLHLEGLEKQYPKQLSGGQAQRVALARILASQPNILLLDEPFSALDAHLKEEIQMDLMELLQHYEGQMAMVTHNRDEAYKMCDEILIVDGGKAQILAPKKEVFEDTRSLIVARLTGCKNIVAAQKIDAHKIWVEQWACLLRLEREVPDGLTHIGMRAHHWIPVTAKDQAENQLSVEVERCIESLFHYDILLKCGLDSESQIWWKANKTKEGLQIPTHLKLRDEHILLLTEA